MARFSEPPYIKGVMFISTKKEKSLVGKIGWCDAQTLGLDTGHFVFIRRVYRNKCSVNTFTSIKDQKGRFKFNKLNMIEKGEVYPVSTKDLNLPRFSGVHKNVITNVPLNKIIYIGNHSLKRRHHHYIQKYVKK